MCRIRVIASPTYVNRSTAPSGVNFAKSAGTFNGSGKTGPYTDEIKEYSSWNSQSSFDSLKLTFPGHISTVMPSACGITRISEKMIDASKSNRRRGCIVTSHASSGVRHTVKKSCCFRTSYNETEMQQQLESLCQFVFVLCTLTWNSGKYRPACRITQTGTRSTSSPRAARNKLSFFSTGKF